MVAQKRFVVIGQQIAANGIVVLVKIRDEISVFVITREDFWVGDASLVDVKIAYLWRHQTTLIEALLIGLAILVVVVFDKIV